MLSQKCLCVGNFACFVGQSHSLLKFIICIFSDLKKIAELQGIPIDLEPYVKKLNNSRRRVMLVNNILQNAQVHLIMY